MKKSDLLGLWQDIPDNAEIVISKCFVVDEKENITAVLDVPVVGTAFAKEDNEMRFILSLEDVKKCFHPKDVKFFDKDETEQEKKEK